MKHARLLLGALLLGATGFGAQAQTAQPVQKAEPPVSQPQIQVIANQGSQGSRMNGELQKVSHGPESAQLILGHWQMTKITYPDGAVIKEQKAEERDRFKFVGDKSVSVVKNGYAAEGFWKFSPEGGQLIISDQSSNQSVQYTVQHVSREELVLFYADELKGGRVLHFVPVP